jgi:hypothetical protein
MNESHVSVALEAGADALYLRDFVWLDSSSKFVTICSFLLDSLCSRSQHLILQDCYICVKLFFALKKHVTVTSAQVHYFFF